MDNRVNPMRNNGVLRLPPGFRFHPTDEELVVQYLRRKVLSYPLPVAIIPEADVCKSDPWDLPGGLEQERYFFSTTEVKYPNGHRANRATSSGYWKATGLDKPVVSGKGRELVGMKKTLVFYKGKPPKGRRTDWVMHEYRLNNPKNVAAQGKNWVLCRIFLKKRGNKIGADEANGVVINGGVDGGPVASAAPVFYDFLAKERRADLNQVPPANSTSGSSGITEVSNKNESEDHEESSSCCNSNSFILSFRQKQCP